MAPIGEIESVGLSAYEVKQDLGLKARTRASL